MNEKDSGGEPAPAGDPASAAPSNPATVLTPRQRAMKWLTFSLRWGIAIVGIWWVVSQITWRDRVTILNASNHPEERRVADLPDLNSSEFKLLDGSTVKRPELVNLPDARIVKVLEAGGKVERELLALDLTDDLKRVERFLVKGADGKGVWIAPARTADYKLNVPHPIVEVGLHRMTQDALGSWRIWLLVGAVLIFPVTFIVTSLRWHKLLAALDIHISRGRAFVLNMVGAFYNSFLIGSTGGDVLKAYYASKQTLHRTRAVMSVLVDRVIGMLALIVVGGTMAAYQWYTGSADDPASHACGKIAIICGLIFAGATAGFLAVGQPGLRSALGIEWLVSKLPKQRQVRNAVQAMEMYGQRKMLVLGAMLMTIPVHVTVVLSAMLAGKAFGLTISNVYYFVAVPVIVLVGSIPISFQGAGVMEYFAIMLVGRQGGTVSQAFALTMSIRMVQILWNLTGGIFVFRGGYHQPSAKEQRAMEVDGAEPQAA